VRAEVLAPVGGLAGVITGEGVVDRDGVARLGEVTGATREAVAARAAAVEVFVGRVRAPARAASKAGVANRLIARVTGLGYETVSHLTGVWQPDSAGRSGRVDPLRERWMRWWGPARRSEEITLPDGSRVDAAEFERRARMVDEDGREYQLTLLVDGRVVALLGAEGFAVYDLSDGHFHHSGYDDPSGAYIEAFLQKMADSGHQGVITFHPIPQRGVGLATVGGSFYYAVLNVLTLGVLHRKRMLSMWGQFPDVRLIDTVRHLPDDLRWRAVVGIVGARMDLPGALGYLRTMAVLDPDLMALIGETTIAKEAVTDLLGDQAIHTLNPVWVTLVRKLVTATALLRAAHHAGELPEAALRGAPGQLASLITAQEVTDPARAAGLAGLLVDHLSPIAKLLEKAGHGAAAAELRAAQAEIDANRLPVFNPHLRELLRASSEIGYLVVLHNDFGLARVAGDGRFAPGAPDERFGAPLLNLIAEYPRAKLIVAHLGVGKWTTLTVEHLELIRSVLEDPRYAHVSFDYSWNDVARHLMASAEVTDAFIELVRDHHDRLIFGSDGIKAESPAQYHRTAHDLDLIFRRIRAEIDAGRMDPRAIRNIRHANLERRLAEAREDVGQWAFTELSSDRWDEVRAQLSQDRNRIIDEWMAAQGHRTADVGSAVGPDYRLDDGTSLGWRDNRQVRNVIRWHNAVTPKVRDGARLTPAMVAASLCGTWNDWRAGAHDRRAARAARRAAGRSSLPAATDTEGLDLRDPDSGERYTVEALTAAGQAAHAAGPDWALQVLTRTQVTQLQRNTDQAQMTTLRTRSIRATIVSAAVFAAVGAAGAAAVLAAGPVAATVATPAFIAAGYWAFSVRGGLNQIRGTYAQQMRVLIESIMERGQFDIATLRVLIEVMGKYAYHDGASPERLAAFDEAANDFLRRAHVLLAMPLAGWESASGRHARAVKEFSTFLDEAAVALGVQAQSLQAFAPHAGILGRLVNTGLVVTFVVNLVVHIAGWQTGFGLDAWVNGTYAAADLLFLAQALPVAVAGWAGWDAGAHPLLRRIVHLGALPVITVANLLLVAQLGVALDPTVIPAVVLTVSAGYLTRLAVTAELRLGRPAPRKGAWANAWLNAGLLAFGLAALLPTQPLAVVLATVGVGIALRSAAAIDTWRYRHRPRGPPPSSRASVIRH
jgi:hypothetical protein